MSTSTVRASASNERIAAEIRAELGRQDLTQKDLADRLGRPKQTVQRWVKEGKGLDFDAVQEIADTLGVSALDLLRAAAFRCTPPRLDHSVPAQVRRLHSGATPYLGPLRRASDLDE
jgi:transcriptional regulator with XRE-family HTH domain